MIIERGISEEQLIETGRISTSTHPFVVGIRAVLPGLDQKIQDRLQGQKEIREHSVEHDLRVISRPLLWNNCHSGFGYMAPSFNNSKEDDILASALVSRLFKEGGMKTEPIIVPVDLFYAYHPDVLSLVNKMRIFDERIGQKERLSLILTDFSDSEIFTDDVLNKIPNQDELGLGIYKDGGEFARKIMSQDIRYKIGGILENEKSIGGTLQRLSEVGNPESVRLLLSTILLLSDLQMWQSLWYGGKKNGTPLYIVGPAIFHHAMNRLNLCWGYGGIDYHYRASNSLGALDEPLFDREVEMPSYYEVGLSKDEFRRIIEPVLAKLYKTKIT